MAENKTQKTGASVEDFLASVENRTRREDGFRLLQMMQEVTGLEPEMWGPSMVGFGDYHYRYESGREGDIFLTGFSPRKQSLSLYIMAGFDAYEGLLSRLGQASHGSLLPVHQQAGGTWTWMYSGSWYCSRSSTPGPTRRHRPRLNRRIRRSRLWLSRSQRDSGVPPPTAGNPACCGLPPSTGETMGCCRDHGILGESVRPSVHQPRPLTEGGRIHRQ